MFTKLFALFTAAAMTVSLIPNAPATRTAAVKAETEQGIVWDCESDFVTDFEGLLNGEYGCFAIDGDEDGYCWEWSDDDDMPHYEGKGFIYSLSSLNNTALDPNNVLVTPAFTGSSFSFYANEAAEGDYSDTLSVYLTSDSENWDEVLCEKLNAEPTLYTLELDPDAPYNIVMFQHHSSAGQAGVVIDYMTVPDGEPYEASDDPWVPEVPDGMIGIMGAEAFGLYEPERGAYANANVSIPENVNYSIDEYYWNEYNPEEGWSSMLEHDDTFSGEEGMEYFLTIVLKPDDGYWFDLNGDIKLDDETANVEEYSIDMESGYLTIESIHFTIEPEDLEYIDTIKIEGYETPVAGMNAHESALKAGTPKDANYEIIKAFWVDENYDQMEDDQCFEAGKTYYFIAKVRPLSGYAFVNEDMQFMINDDTSLVSEDGSYVIHSQLAYICTAGVVAEEPQAEPTEAPVEPTEAPAEPTEAPAEPTEAPAEPTEAPAEPTEAPAEPTEAPAEPTEAPAPIPAPSTGGVSLLLIGIAAAAAGAAGVLRWKKED